MKPLVWTPQAPKPPLAAFTVRLAPVCLWRQTAVQRLPLPERRKRVARASMAVALDSAPHWTIVDTHGIGAAAYRTGAMAEAAPALEPWQAECLEAIRHLRRWRYYADSALPEAAPNLPLDGCACRSCLLSPEALRAERSQPAASALRQARYRARCRTLAARQRSAARVEAALAASANSAHQDSASGSAKRRSACLPE